MLTSRRWYIVTETRKLLLLLLLLSHFVAHCTTADFVKINREMPTGTKTSIPLYGYEH